MTRHRIERAPALLLVAFLLAVSAGCGNDAGGPASTDVADGETRSQRPGEATAEQPGDPDHPAGDVVAILTETGVGGTVASLAVPVGDDAARQRFGRQFSDQRMRDRIEAETAGIDLRTGSRLYAAVVAVGCDVPPGVVITLAAAGVAVTPEQVAAPRQECLAPMTSVALVVVADPA